jgi:hypothetical protein
MHLFPHRSALLVSKYVKDLGESLGSTGIWWHIEVHFSLSGDDAQTALFLAS